MNPFEEDDSILFKHYVEIGAIDFVGIEENGEAIYKVNEIAQSIAPELWKAHTDYIDETLIGLYKENLISVSYNENLEATFSATPEGLKRLKKHYGIVPERDSKDDNSWG